MRTILTVAATALLTLALVLIPSTPPRVSVPRHERNLSVKIVGRNGAPARLALADVAVIAETPGLADAARVVGEVLRQDLAFEEAFAVLPGEAAGSGTPGPQDADGLAAVTLRQRDTSLEIEVRISKTGTGEEAFARGYVAPASQARTAAHAIADEIHLQLAGVRGVANTRLAFVSDRGGMRRELGGMLRHFKEIWSVDYDGANERRITSDGDLDMTPSWSPDGRAVAYTSLRPGFQDIFVSLLDQRRVVNPTRGTGTNRLPAWSPDGMRIAFATVRDGNEEIYVINRDGSGSRRLTRHPAIDTAPAWSPDGAQIAFTSNRTGSPQIWVMDADGSNAFALTAEKYCDRPTWSPPPHNEIAYVSRTTTGFDIKVIDLATREARQLTFGHGFNESPSFSPNGRHIAFASTRRGGQQIWIISRTGDGLRQVTTIGNNTMPNWSK